MCVAVWAINIGHFSDPVHGGSWIKVRISVKSCNIFSLTLLLIYFKNKSNVRNLVKLIWIVSCIL